MCMCMEMCFMCVSIYVFVRECVYICVYIRVARSDKGVCYKRRLSPEAQTSPVQIWALSFNVKRFLEHTVTKTLYRKYENTRNIRDEPPPKKTPQWEAISNISSRSWRCPGHSYQCLHPRSSERPSWREMENELHRHLITCVSMRDRQRCDRTLQSYHYVSCFCCNYTNNKSANCIIDQLWVSVKNEVMIPEIKNRRASRVAQR